MERYIIFKLICLVACLDVTFSDTNEQTAKELIEHILRIPHPDRVLNTVLGTLQKNRNELIAAKIAEEEDCEETPETLPEYTEALRNSRELGLRHIGAPKHYPICHIERKIRRLNTIEYEYRPAYYEEVKCMPPNEELGVTNEICTSLGFSCVQWNKTIHLTRRRYTSDCWETRTMVIPAGCECMWPVHKLGDIKLHL